jgi:hypothetical protein
MTAGVRTVLLKPTSPPGPGIRFELTGDDTLTGGAGGWNDVARPRRRAALEWVGTPAYQLILPLLLDGMETTIGHDTVIEPQCRQVAAWATKDEKTGRPTILKATGPIRVGEQKRWVIQDITWEGQVRNKKGRRIQQHLTVTLKEYIEATVLKSPVAKAKAGNS